MRCYKCSTFFIFTSCFGIRHLIAVLLLLGSTVCYALRVDMSIGIVAMTDNETLPGIPTFNWTSPTQNTILSSFFWGYVVTQVPSGLIAQAVGAKWILFAGVLVNSLVAMLTPIAAISGGWGAVCAIRVIQGLTQATLFPCMHATLSKWAPPTERGRLASIAFAGNQIGTIIALPLSGFLASSTGWPSIFYVMGAFGIVWCILWALLSASQPSEHRCIRHEEVKYIEASLGDKDSTVKFSTPWASIFTSPAMWAVIIAHSAQNWGFWTLLTEIPIYMKTVLNYDLKSNGLLSALPYLVMAILSFVFGFIADRTIKGGYTSVSFSRKLFNSIGFWGPAVSLIILAYIPKEQKTAAVTLLVLAVGLNAGVYVGFQVNHIDLSPNFAGTMMGITNGISNIFSIIAPLVVGQIVTEEGNVAQWRIVFWISAVIYSVGNVLFIILGRTDIQPWDDPNYMRTDSKKNKSQNEEPSLS